MKLFRATRGLVTRELNPEKHSFEAVGIYKVRTDVDDKFLIYEINNSKLTGEPGFFFKSNLEMEQVALLMDQDGIEYDLQGKAY